MNIFIRMLINIGLLLAEHYSAKSSNRVDDFVVKEASKTIRHAIKRGGKR